MRALTILLLLVLAGCSPIPSAELLTDANETEATFGELAVISAQGFEQPHPHAVWVQGAYQYDAGRYVWVPGHWEDPTPALAR